MRHRGLADLVLRLTSVASLTIAMFLTPWTAEIAYACSCVHGIPATVRAETTDVIVVGIVAFLREEETRFTSGGFPYPTPWTVTVDAYMKGSGKTSLAVNNSAFCEFSVEEGKRYLLFLNNYDGEYWTGLCSGNTAADTVGGQLWIQEVRLATWLNLLPGGTTFHRVALQVAAAGVVGLAGVAAWVRGRLTRRA